MTTYPFNLKKIHPSWEEGVQLALLQLDPNYLSQLAHSQNWLPGAENIFNAFTLPIHRINYVLLGESPYPRNESANGYAFWDAAVDEIWSPTGLSKKVNRATSLRNILKMLLIAEGLLSPPKIGQENIARINKSSLIQTNTELFSHFLECGFFVIEYDPRFTTKLTEIGCACMVSIYLFDTRLFAQKEAGCNTLTLRSHCPTYSSIS